MKIHGKKTIAHGRVMENPNRTWMKIVGSPIWGNPTKWGRVFFLGHISRPTWGVGKHICGCTGIGSDWGMMGDYPTLLGITGSQTEDMSWEQLTGVSLEFEPWTTYGHFGFRQKWVWRFSHIPSKGVNHDFQDEHDLILRIHHSFQTYPIDSTWVIFTSLLWNVTEFWCTWIIYTLVMFPIGWYTRCAISIIANSIIVRWPKKNHPEIIGKPGGFFRLDALVFSIPISFPSGKTQTKCLAGVIRHGCKIPAENGCKMGKS